MKIITVVGARPQFIKAAVVSRAIAQYNQNQVSPQIQEILVHTGQHYDANLSDVFFTEMQISKPRYNLGLGGLTHGVMTGRLLEQLETVLLEEKPDLTLVYGDTNSTLAAALASVKLHIPVGHVEAGLRSFNKLMPEEINRVLTDHSSQWLFCPTETSFKNLKREGITSNDRVKVEIVGDVMYDAALFYRTNAKPTEKTLSLIEDLKDNFYLATIHREENTNNPSRLSNIIQALDTISENIPVILPLHPRTRKYLGNIPINHIQAIDPVSYFDMITLLPRCQGVFTDSGGLQKEAFFFHKPCIILRDETEWVELIDYGYNTLVGSDINKICMVEKQLKNKLRDYSKPLYGNGNAGQKIITLLFGAK